MQQPSGPACQGHTSLTWLVLARTDGLGALLEWVAITFGWLQRATGLSQASLARRSEPIPTRNFMFVY